MYGAVKSTEGRLNLYQTRIKRQRSQQEYEQPKELKFHKAPVHSILTCSFQKL